MDIFLLIGILVFFGGIIILIIENIEIIIAIIIGLFVFGVILGLLGFGEDT